MVKRFNLCRPIFVIAVALLVMLVVGTSAGATAEGIYLSSQDAPEILAYNLNYDDRVNIAYAVETNGVDPENIEMVFWYEMPSSVTDEPDYIVTQSSVAKNAQGEVIYSCVFYSEGISPKNAKKQVYSAAHLKGTDVYSEIERYSMLEYLFTRLEKDTITTDQRDLYLAYLECSEKLQLVLDYETTTLPDNHVLVVVDGGVDNEGFNAGVYEKGSLLTLTAEESVSAEGVVSWYNSDGALVGNGNSITVTVGETHERYYAKSAITVEAVGGTVEFEGDAPAIGETATLTAPLDKNVEGTEKHFFGWYDKNDALVSTSARASVVITESNVYTAKYEAIESFDNTSSNDFSNGSGSTSIIGGEYIDDISIYGEIDYNSAARDNNNYLDIKYLSTKYSQLSLSTSKVIGFSFKISDQDPDENEVKNTYKDIFNTTGKTELYSIVIKIGSQEIIALSIVPTVVDNNITGFNIAPASDNEIKLLKTDISIKEVANIAIEISLDETGTTPYAINVYNDGVYNATIALENIVCGSSDNVTFDFKATRYTRAHIVLDDFYYRERAIK